MRVVALVVSACACGRIGFGERGDAPGDPTTIDAPSCGFQRITTGLRLTCVIDATGAVKCWGQNDSGQVLAGGPNPVVTPTTIPLPGPAIDVVAGREFACARLATGDVWCWGDNQEGELGDGLTTGAGPKQVPLAGDTALDLDVGT